MGRRLFPHPDADPAQDQDEARADVRRRIDQLKARGVEHDRAVDAVLPPGSQARAWFFNGG